MFGRQGASSQNLQVSRTWSPEAMARILPVLCGLRQITSPLCFLCSHKGAISKLWEITCMAQSCGEDIIKYQ